jgi:hypothetical protein
VADHNFFANLIWQIADLLRGPYRPPQYERDDGASPLRLRTRAQQGQGSGEHERSKDRFKREALDARFEQSRRPALPHALGSGDRAVIATDACSSSGGQESGCSEFSGFSRFSDESMTTRSTALSKSSRVPGA